MSKELLMGARYSIRIIKESVEQDHEDIEFTLKEVLDFIQKINCAMTYSGYERERECIHTQEDMSFKIKNIQILFQNIINKSIMINTFDEFIYQEELKEAAKEGESNETI